MFLWYRLKKCKENGRKTNYIFIESSESLSDIISSTTNDDETKSINDVEEFEYQNFKVDLNISNKVQITKNTLISLELQKKIMKDFINLSLHSRLMKKFYSP